MAIISPRSQPSQTTALLAQLQQGVQGFVSAREAQKERERLQPLTALQTEAAQLDLQAKKRAAVQDATKQELLQKFGKTAAQPVSEFDVSEQLLQPGEIGPRRSPEMITGLQEGAREEELQNIKSQVQALSGTLVTPGERKRALQEKTTKDILSTKKQVLEINKLQKEIEKMTPTGELSPNITPDNLQVWDKLTNKYNKEITIHKGARQKVQQLKMLLQNNPTGADQISAVFTFMKALDPTSVVRESEFKLPGNAAGVWGNMINFFKKFAKGDILPEKAIRDMIASADKLASFYDGSISDINDRFTGLTNRAGLEADLVVWDTPGLRSVEPPKITRQSQPGPTGPELGTQAPAKQVNFENLTDNELDEMLKQKLGQ